MRLEVKCKHNLTLVIILTETMWNSFPYKNEKLNNTAKTRFIMPTHKRSGMCPKARTSLSKFKKLYSRRVSSLISALYLTFKLLVLVTQTKRLSTLYYYQGFESRANCLVSTYMHTFYLALVNTRGQYYSYSFRAKLIKLFRGSVHQLKL